MTLLFEPVEPIDIPVVIFNQGPVFVFLNWNEGGWGEGGWPCSNGSNLGNHLLFSEASQQESQCLLFEEATLISAPTLLFEVTSVEHFDEVFPGMPWVGNYG